MKILIAYASKTGVTEACVKRLKEQLAPLPVDLCDLGKNLPDLSAYEIVLTGSSVRFGKLLKPVRRFFKEREEELLKKKLGLFLCCGLSHEYEYYYETLIPERLRERAFLTVYFGGSLRPERTTFMERFLLYEMRSRLRESEIEDGEYSPTLPGILPENVDRLATYTRMQLDANNL